MLTLKVPPYVEIRLAETESEKAQLRHQMAFLKSPPDGMHRRDVDSVAMEWRDQVSMNSLSEQAAQFSRLSGNPPLSLDAVQEAVKTIIMAANDDASQWEIFYILHPESLARTAAGVRNRLATARMSENRNREFSGVSVEQKRPITYWLPVTIGGQERKVEVAFHQENGLVSVYGESGWLIVPYPNWIWYLPAEQPAVYLDATYAISKTTEVEEVAFEALLSEAVKCGISVDGAVREPNGLMTFPDYKVNLDGQDWVVEVTRVLGKITRSRVIIMPERNEHSSIARSANQPGIGSKDVDDAIRQAIDDKSQRRVLVASGEMYCLLLVDVMERIDPKDTTLWVKYDLEAFDSVILIHAAPGHAAMATVIKGTMLYPDNSTEPVRYPAGARVRIRTDAPAHHSHARLHPGALRRGGGAVRCLSEPRIAGARRRWAAPPAAVPHPPTANRPVGGLRRPARRYAAGGCVSALAGTGLTA